MHTKIFQVLMPKLQKSHQEYVGFYLLSLVVVTNDISNVQGNIEETLN
jgi:hypothetical protein